MAKRNILKEIWKWLGAPDIDRELSQKEEEELKALEAKTKKEISPKVDTRNKPIDISKIVPQEEQSKDYER